MGNPEKGDEFCCSQIIFQARASVGNIPALNYLQAWADLELTPEIYHNLSAPFRGMVAGDMFVPSAMNGRHAGLDFEVLKPENYTENRFSPTVYQRLWAAAAPMRKDVSGSDEMISVKSADWSHTFNSVTYPYVMGNGFSVYVDNADLPAGQKTLMRFPKTHLKYGYYAQQDGSKLGEVDVTRPDGDLNRFIYEDAAKDLATEYVYDAKTRQLFDRIDQLDIELKADKATTTFLFGNPFMSRIDLDQLLYDNPDIRSVEIQNGASSETISINGPEIIPAQHTRYIEPFQAIFVNVDEAATSMTVSLSRRMIGQPEKAQAAEETQQATPTLSVVASTSSSTSTVVLPQSAGFETETILDSEVTPGVRIFGMDNGRAYNVMSANTAEIPLGIYLSEQTDTVSLSFRSDNFFPRDEYQLVDKQENLTYSLDQPVELADLQSSVGRFALVKLDPMAIDDVESDLTAGAVVEIIGNRLTVKSPEASLQKITVYDLQGKTVAQKTASEPQTQLTADLPSGLLLLTVTFADTHTETYKLLIR